MLVTAAEWCERPTQAPSEARALSTLLHAAKYVAASFGPGVAKDGVVLDANASFLLQ